MPAWFISFLTVFGVPSLTGILLKWLLDKDDVRREARAERRREEADKKDDERDKIQQHNLLMLHKSISASIRLGEANAIALQNGCCNGETKSALAYAQTVRLEHEAFLADMAIQTISK